MSNNKNTYRSAVLLCGLATSGLAAADDFHYINMQMGDRASGMAGAYTAVSDDPSGLFYNPAGLTYMGTRNLSASMNAYHTTNLKYKGVLGGGDWKRESGNLVPNFFGVAQPMGIGVFGFSYAATDAIVENQDSVFYNVGTQIKQFTLNLNNEEKTYKIGPSFALAVNDDLSVGITLYAHLRDTETIFNQNIILNDDTYEWSNNYTQTSEVGIEPIIGVMWSPLDKVSFGLSVRTTQLLSAEQTIQQAVSTDIGCTTGTACPSTVPTPTLINASETRSYPISTSVGIAYFPSDKLIYSIDFDYHSTADGGTKRASNKTATWNVKAGMEYYLYSNWALRGGIYTNNANTPEIDSSKTDQDQHINLLGFSLSATRFSRNSSLSVGVNYASGTGEAQVISGTTATQDVDANNLSLFLSTSYSY